LGRMLSEPASRLNAPLRILDTPDDNCSPAKMITPGPHHRGSFADAEAVHNLAKEVDLITVEIEHVNAEILKHVVLQNGKDKGKQTRVYPGPDLIMTIQDKYVQKKFLSSKGFPIPAYMLLEPSSNSDNADNWREPVERAAAKLGWPLVLKARKQAYDGKGNAVVRDISSACKEAARLQKASNGGGIYVEKMVPFVRELAGMVARSRDGQHFVSYPIVETIHRNSVCHVVMCPANVDDKIRRKAQEIAYNAVIALGECDLMEGAVGYDGAVGVFAVEMFQSEDGEYMLRQRLKAVPHLPF
jgi:phosphoribosylaminoimidazole carboxylase